MIPSHQFSQPIQNPAAGYVQLPVQPAANGARPNPFVGNGGVTIVCQGNGIRAYNPHNLNNVSWSEINLKCDNEIYFARNDEVAIPVPFNCINPLPFAINCGAISTYASLALIAANPGAAIYVTAAKTFAVFTGAIFVFQLFLSTATCSLKSDIKKDGNLRECTKALFGLKTFDYIKRIYQCCDFICTGRNF